MAKKKKWGLTTHKQVRFVEEYLVDLNATQAAKRAGYSEKTASVIGVENLKKPLIAAAVAAHMAELSKKTEITVERVLAEYAKLAFSDLEDFVKWKAGNISLEDSTALPEGLTACVQEVKESVAPSGTVTTSIKLHDKKGALDALGKHLGMFRERVDLNIGDDGPPINIYIPDNNRGDK